MKEAAVFLQLGRDHKETFFCREHEKNKMDKITDQAKANVMITRQKGNGVMDQAVACGVRGPHRDLSIHIERVLCETLLRPVIYQAKVGIVRARKLEVMPKIILFS